ncbi:MULTISPECIES: DUF7167 family protein [Bacillus]|uniref:DUF7167 domain-containing protein n=1 Tax=Bacillus pseudomycoides TaxID=64104 RepID=A0A1Y3M6X0_9BACI|nr:hypothetical protein [Bacillus pseudomycoides]OUM46175.1 hypothetical protein BW425_25170 [Bacillus pseudomycoides]
MDPNTKVRFTLSIGYVGAKHDETFTLNELGYYPETDKDVEDFLEQKWKEWSANYIDGGWSFEED